MKAELETETTVYIVCPHCKKGRNEVSHLFAEAPRKWGPWSCGECGGQFSGVVNSPDDVEVTPIHGERWVKTFNLLVIEPQEKPIYFVVESGRPDPRSEGEAEELSYLYDEGTCPTNWLQSVEAIISEGDSDPHGIAVFVRTVDREGLGDDPDWSEVFPEAFDGPVIDGELAVKRLTS